MIDEEIKKNLRRETMRNIILISILVIITLAVLGLIGFEIYLWVHYGNMPKDQIPAWVWWWMLGGRK